MRLKKLIRHLPDNVAQAIADALDLEVKGEGSLAVQRLLPLIEQHPELTVIHACLAFLLSCSGAHDAAIERRRKAVLMSPAAEKTSLVYFHVLYKAGRRKEAVEEMERYLAIRPSKEYAEIAKDLEGFLTSNGTGPLASAILRGNR